jgi:integrase
MAGSMYRRPSGLWVLRVYAGRDPLTGKKVWRSRTVRGTKREAERELAAFVTEQPSAQAPAPSRTFGELLERWFEARSGDWSPSTAQQTRWVINGNLKGLSDRKVASIGVEDLDRFYAALRERGRRGGRPLAGSTVARTHTIVRLALKQAVVWGWRADNPAERANPGRYDSAEIQPPSADDVRRLFDAAFEKDHELLTFVALEAETGARRSELAALRFTDFAEGSVSISRSLVVGIDSDENQRRYAGHYWRATVRRGERPTAVIEKPKPKNRRSVRTIALSAPAALLVAELRAQQVARAEACGITLPSNSFVFAADVDGSRPIRPETWTRRFTRLRAEVGLDTVRLHDLRHFVATTLLAAGTDLATVAGRLGHGSGGKTTLAIYGHFLRGAAPDRAAADLLASLVRPPAPPPTAEG